MILQNEEGKSTLAYFEREVNNNYFNNINPSHDDLLNI